MIIVLQTEYIGEVVMVKNNNNGSNNKAAIYLTGLLLSFQSLAANGDLPPITFLIMVIFPAVLSGLMFHALSDDIADEDEDD